MTLRRIYIGVDSRQPLAYTVLQSSIIARTSTPVAIHPLLLWTLPIQRRGLTEFTFSRYLPPFLQGYKGTALFLDADMVVRADIEELFQLADPQYAVQVVDTPKRFERPSLMLFNCQNCQALTPEFIESGEPQALEWGPVGFLPKEWNNCIGYEPADENAKIVHYTTGIPVFDEVQGLGHEDTWRDELRAATRTVPWQDIMGGSVHAEMLRAKGR